MPSLVSKTMSLAGRAEEARRRGRRERLLSRRKVARDEAAAHLNDSGRIS
jgi:hypothetical protein